MDVKQQLEELTKKYINIIDFTYAYFTEKIYPINSTYFKIYVCNDVQYYYSFFANKKTTKIVSGCLIPPNESNNKFIILIEEKEFLKKNIPAISVIIHELVHLYDYMQYCEQILDNDLLKLDSLSADKDLSFDSFYYYSEFHAYYITPQHFYCLQMKMHNESIKEKEMKDYFYNNYFPLYHNKLLDNINNNTIGFYEIVAYMGRYAACNDIIGCDMNDFVFAPDRLKSKLYINIYKFLYNTTKCNYDIRFLTESFSHIRSNKQMVTSTSDSGINSTFSECISFAR